MDNVVFQTPSGHSVTLKPHLSYPEKRRLQRVFLSSATIDPQTGERKLDLGVQIDAQDTLLKIMVRRIQLTSGKAIEGTEEAVFNGLSELADTDIRAIYDKLDELTQGLDIFPTPERKKKERPAGA